MSDGPALFEAWVEERRAQGESVRTIARHFHAAENSVWGWLRGITPNLNSRLIIEAATGIPATSWPKPPYTPRDDLPIGLPIGHIKAKRLLSRSSEGATIECECVCGKLFPRLAVSLRRALRTGEVSSCGCRGKTG